MLTTITTMVRMVVIIFAMACLQTPSVYKTAWFSRCCLCSALFRWVVYTIMMWCLWLLLLAIARVTFCWLWTYEGLWKFPSCTHPLLLTHLPRSLHASWCLWIWYVRQWAFKVFRCAMWTRLRWNTGVMWAWYIGQRLCMWVVHDQCVHHACVHDRLTDTSQNFFYTMSSLDTRIAVTCIWGVTDLFVDVSDRVTGNLWYSVTNVLWYRFLVTGDRFCAVFSEMYPISLWIRIVRTLEQPLGAVFFSFHPLLIPLPTSISLFPPPRFLSFFPVLSFALLSLSSRRFSLECVAAFLDFSSLLCDLWVMWVLLSVGVRGAKFSFQQDATTRAQRLLESLTAGNVVREACVLCCRIMERGMKHVGCCVSALCQPPIELLSADSSGRLK